MNGKALASYGGWTPLHGAAARNSAGIVAVLLKYGADRTATDAKGSTALQVAEQGGFAEAANVLRASVAVSPASAAASSAVVAGPAARPPSSTGGSVQGTVLWNGQPVAGATVYVADDAQPGSRYRCGSDDRMQLRSESVYRASVTASRVALA